jgi:hypothetical protein
MDNQFPGGVNRSESTGTLESRVRADIEDIILALRSCDGAGLVGRGTNAGRRLADRLEGTLSALAEEVAPRRVALEGASHEVSGSIGRTAMVARMRANAKAAEIREEVRILSGRDFSGRSEVVRLLSQIRENVDAGRSRFPLQFSAQFLDAAETVSRLCAIQSLGRLGYKIESEYHRDGTASHWVDLGAAA